jgi:hypothetical protein
MLYVSHINADNTISIKDSVSKQIQHFPNEVIMNPASNLPPILGRFLYPNKVELHEITWDNGSDCLMAATKYTIIYNNNEPIGDKGIKNQAIYAYLDVIRHIIPKYIFEIPASSTGKYHPACDAGKGGLKRHLICVEQTLEWLTEPEFSKGMFNSDVIDLMKVACIMHDGLKNGWTHEKYTRFDHPLLMANAIRGCKFGIPDNYVELIAHCIESHMGQWNIDEKYNPGIVLPKPMDKYQYFVHLADYVASRADISFVIEGNLYYSQYQHIVDVEKMGDEEPQKYEYTPQTVTKTRLSDKDVQLVNKAIQKASSVEISSALIKKYGIEGTKDKILNVWNSLVTYKTCSEKQNKYLNLAKDYVNKQADVILY